MEQLLIDVIIWEYLCNRSILTINLSLVEVELNVDLLNEACGPPMSVGRASKSATIAIVPLIYVLLLLDAFLY